MEVWQTNCRWTDEGCSAGTLIIVGEQNRLGDRRIRIISKPDSMFGYKTTANYARAKLWAASANQIAPSNAPPKLRVVK